MKLDDVERLVRFGRALGSSTRVRIVGLLRGRVLCVNALAAELDVTQGAVSQHLRVLREAGIVVSEKRGYFIHYRLNDETLGEWTRLVEELLDNKRGASSGKAGASGCGRQGRKSSGCRSRKS